MKKINVGSACQSGHQAGKVTKPSLLSLFSGAGGMDSGFVAAGCDVVAAVEQWAVACQTHRKNFPDTTLFEGDVTDPKIRSDIIEFLKGTWPDIVAGGAPCQGYSVLGQHDPNDPRNRLVLDFLWFVEQSKAKIFVLENVEGITSTLLDGEPAIDLIVRKAAALGYKAEYRLLCAADYGVAQKRNRVILIGTRYDTPILFPEPTHGPDGSGLKPYVTVRQAIGDLENAPQDGAFGHVLSDPSPVLMKRIKATQPGEALYDNHGFRLHPDRQAVALTNNLHGSVAHYSADRMISIREAARIQGFSDAHIVCGSKSEMAKQIGNALPPPMARAIAASVLKMLDAIRAGAPQLAAAASEPDVSSTTIDGEALKAEITGMRKDLIRKLNVEQKKIDAANGRTDSLYLHMGMLVGKHIEAAKACGEMSEDRIFKSIVKDDDCKVGKGALYNARRYWVTYTAMVEKFGKAPVVSMTHYVKVRNDNLTIEEQHDLLLKAEAEGLTAAKLQALAAGKLNDKGLGKSKTAPDSELAANCKKALTALTKTSALLKKGIVPSTESVLILNKTAMMASVCLKAAGRMATMTEAPSPFAAKGDIPARKAS